MVELISGKIYNVNGSTTLRIDSFTFRDNRFDCVATIDQGTEDEDIVKFSITESIKHVQCQGHYAQLNKILSNFFFSK